MALHCGLKVVFAEINQETLTICPRDVEKKITPHTKVIIPVHVAGNMCNMHALQELAQKYNLYLIEDCAHAIESEYKGIPSGTLGDIGTFSFYATKNLTTAEGGMLVTKNPEMAHKVKLLRSHGVDKEIWKRRESIAYQQYDVLMAGFKYNMFDIQAAIGLGEMENMHSNYEKRKNLYNNYVQAFSNDSRFELIKQEPHTKHAYHLFILKLNTSVLPYTRDEIMQKMKEKGVETSVHFFPVPLYTYYRNTFGYTAEQFSVSYHTYLQLISLPLYPELSETQQKYVMDTLYSVIEGK
jgi:dTDP-4-amino-4,6-dideoxygalactose transaminase